MVDETSITFKEEITLDGEHDEINSIEVISICSNGTQLVLMTPSKILIFNHEDGKNLLDENVSSSELIMTYDVSDGYFYHSDVACYGWLKRFKIRGFKEPLKHQKSAGDT